MEETAKRIQDQVEQAKSIYQDKRRAVEDLAKTASDKSKEALAFTDQWVHENPWMALGMIAGVGLLLGVLIAQSLDRD
jgi:ElaB/YqjD/DUF883 family membrane-anchored ribosome-binding protein